jgi:SAM-dependent methyltransferase
MKKSNVGRGSRRWRTLFSDATSRTVCEGRSARLRVAGWLRGRSRSWRYSADGRAMRTYSARDDWWRTFFTPTVLAVMESERGLEAARREVAFLRSRLNLPSGTRVLDVMCGAGRLTQALAETGFEATGLDLNDTTIRLARRRLREAELGAGFVRSDVRTFSGRFDSAVWHLGSFGYFANEKDHLIALRNVVRSVGRGGYVALEVENRDAYALAEPVESVRGVPGREAHERWLFDHARSRVGILWRTDSREHVASIRAFALHEVLDLVEGAGCDLVDLYGSAEGEPWEPGCRVHYVICTRR